MIVFCLTFKGPQGSGSLILASRVPPLVNFYFLGSVGKRRD